MTSPAVAIKDAVRGVTKDWARQRKTEERNRSAAMNRRGRLMPSYRVTLREAAFEAMAGAYDGGFAAIGVSRSRAGEMQHENDLLVSPGPLVSEQRFQPFATVSAKRPERVAKTDAPIDADERCAGFRVWDTSRMLFRQSTATHRSRRALCGI